MALAKIDIANEALRLMGDSEVNSLEDGSAQSARINAAWKGCVEYLLSRHPWAFALRRVALARAAYTVIGFPYAYAIPADAVRVVSVMVGVGEGASSLPLGTWTQESGHILCHAPRAVCLYVQRTMDVSTWSPGFCGAMAAYLAFVTSRPLSRTEMGPQLEQLFRQRFDAARLDDAAHQPESPSHAVMTSVMAARLGQGLGQGHDDRAIALPAVLNAALTMEGIG